MSQLTDQQLSPAAAHRILRSIAYWDWSKLEQAPGLAQESPVIVEVPAVLDLPAGVDGPAHEQHVADLKDDKDDTEDTDEGERTPAPAFSLSKRAGGWYLNEVPEELIAECERELSTSDPLIDLTRAAGTGREKGASEKANPERFVDEVPRIMRSFRVVRPMTQNPT
jgi:hypothetical protein